MTWTRVPRIRTELGIERLCRACGEFWPDLDREFWYLDSQGRVMGRCRACWSERSKDQWGKRHHKVALS
jgi:hypothetical protein